MEKQVLIPYETYQRLKAQTHSFNTTPPLTRHPPPGKRNVQLTQKHEQKKTPPKQPEKEPFRWITL